MATVEQTAEHYAVPTRMKEKDRSTAVFLSLLSFGYKIRVVSMCSVH